MITETPIAALPADPRDWDLEAIVATLGFDSISGLCATLGSIDRGYSLFALQDESRKRRVIAAPNARLKSLQRRAYDSILSRLSLLDCVHSCPGRGVVTNARQHLNNGYLTVMDVASCFPSTRMPQVCAAFEGAGVSSDIAGILTRLTTLHGILPEGPPTSPAVLNLVFRPIDEEMLRVAEDYRAVYTRYMDDLAFSGDTPLRGLDRRVVRVLERFGYQSNQSKTRVWGPGNPHTITSIVVSASLNPTPEFVRDLLKHLKCLERGNCQLTEQQIRGKINWVRDLNKGLARTLERRHRMAVNRATRRSISG